jgi:phosphatidate cytidylyltransferase
MTRLLSGVALAAAAIAAILFLPVLAVRLLASLVAVLAAHEFLRIIARESGSVRRSRSANPAPILLIVALTCWYMLLPAPQVVLALVLIGVAWLAIEVLFSGLPVEDASSRFVAQWYIGMPLGMLVSVHGLNGPTATLLLLATVVVSDTAQYYTGRAFGRRPLAPTISPKKTIEGAVGGLVVATLFMALAGPRVLPGAAPLPLAGLGLTIAVLGMCGDLFESRLKRDAGVKDSSTLIPGHGGVLDRIDALLFAVPAFYLYLRP